MSKIRNFKQTARRRRIKKTRMSIRFQRVPRLSVFRSAVHLYAQIMVNDKVVAGASTQHADIRGVVSKTGNVKAAALVGKLIAEKARTLNIQKVAFDRSGYAYHGRIKVLAEAARENGLEF